MISLRIVPLFFAKQPTKLVFRKCKNSNRNFQEFEMKQVLISKNQWRDFSLIQLIKLIRQKTYQKFFRKKSNFTMKIFRKQRDASYNNHSQLINQQKDLNNRLNFKKNILTLMDQIKKNLKRWRLNQPKIIFHHSRYSREWIKYIRSTIKLKMIHHYPNNL